MVRGLPASIIAHAAVLGLTYVTLPYWGSSIYIAPTESVNVTIADIGEINNIRPDVRIEPEQEAAPEDIPEDTVPEEDFEEDLPETAEDIASVPPAPEAEPDPSDVLPDFEDPEDEPEVENEKPEPEPEPEPRPRPVDPLDAFLNQSESTFETEIKTKKKRPPPPPKDEPEEKKENTTFVPPETPDTTSKSGAGERNANIARVESILYGRVLPCWDGVSDLPYPDKLNVRMSLSLKRNGQIDNLRLIEPTRRPLGNSPMGTAVDRALRAVRKCAPYNLPEEDYEYWKEGSVNLGPAFTSTNQR